MPFLLSMNELEDTYDIIVAGGGPAGLSAAFSAAKSGARVAVFEKSKEIGYPIHTSGGSWIEELRKLKIPEKFMHPIWEGIFVSPNVKAFLKFEKPPSCILDIRGLYQYLAELASKMGTCIFVNSSVVDLDYCGARISGLKVRRKGKFRVFKAPLVIDATGAAGLLARKAGLSKGFSRVGIGAEYDLVAPDWPQNRVAFLFGREMAPSGYAWVFPRPESRIRVGVGIINVDTNPDPQVYLDRILNSNIFGKQLLNGSQIEYHSGVIPSELYLSKTTSDGILTVGDAAGLTSTLLGEGIRFAIDIGRMAGEVAGEAVRNKRFDQNFLARFEKRWKKKYQRIFQIGAFINERLSRYSDDDWDRKINLLAQLNPAFLPRILKGEFDLKFIAQLSLSNPGLLKSSTVSLLRSLF